jgi:predicted  nucleic acid-binding Zn-ribbon protein
MSTTQRIIALYIHPDSGPILPMPLDMMAVEMMALKAPGSIQRDDARIREVAKRIREKFPDVDPESRWREVASLIGRLSHADLFNGIVLRLPGKIEEEIVASSELSKATLEELDRLAKEIQQLNKGLQKERVEHEATKAKFYAIESENKRLKVLYDKANTEIADLRVQAQHAAEKVERARARITSTSAARDATEQEAAGLKIQLEQAQKELQARPDFEAELSLLRQRVTSAEHTERQLCETIEERERKIDELQERIRYLTEDTQAEDTPGSDPFADW